MKIKMGHVTQTMPLCIGQYLPNLKCLASTIGFYKYMKNIKMGRVTTTMPIWGLFVTNKQGLATVNLSSHVSPVSKIQ